MAGKNCPLTKIWVNNAMHEDLNWATHHMHASLRINLLSSMSLDAEDTDVTVFCDACIEGLAFYYPDCLTGFYAPVPNESTYNIILYFEALAVASTCNDLKKMMTHQLHIIIYTNSMNMVDIFSFLNCLPEFNPLLQHCVNVMIMKEFQI